MVQGLLRSDTLSRVVNKDLLEQVKEVLEEGVVVGGDGILVLSVIENTVTEQNSRTVRCFMAFTKRREPRVVSGVG